MSVLLSSTIVLAIGVGAAQTDPSIDAIVTRLDEAVTLLFEELPVEASGLTCRFGLPTDGQRRRARRVAREMFELTEQAELATQQAIRDLESRRDPQTRALADRLGDERNGRLPFLRGVAACLHADFNLEDPSTRGPLYVLAGARLEPLADLLPGRLGGLARLYAGLARLGAGHDDRAAALLERAASTPAASPADVFTARMGLVLIAEAADGPRAGLEALDRFEIPGDELLFAVLAADQRFRLLTTLALDATGDRRRMLVADAYRSYLDLLEGDDAGRVRDVVTARLVEVVDADAPFEILAGLVVVARARQLAGRPDTRRQGIALFETLLESDRLDPTDRADTLLGLARAQLAEDPSAAASRFLQLGREHPASRHAERAIELAATISAERHRAAPFEPRRRAALRATLELLLDRYRHLPTADAWRYHAGCLALDEGRYDDALAVFETIPAQAEHRPDARVRMVETRRGQAAAAGRPGLWRRVMETAEAVETELRQMLARAGGEQAAQLEAMLVSLALLRAEALVAVGEPEEALELIDRTVPSEDPASLLVRISVYESLGRDAETRETLHRLCEIAGDRAGPILGDLIRARLTRLEQDPPIDTEPQAAGILLPAAMLLDDWLRTAAGEHTRLRLIAADAFRLADRCDEALRLYGRLRADHGDAREVLRGQADCLFAAGEDARAMTLYTRLSVGLGPDDEVFWLAQLRMLQILDRTGRNTHRIAPHIQQLRGKDEELGGERFRVQFERLLRKDRGEGLGGGHQP